MCLRERETERERKTDRQRKDIFLKHLYLLFSDLQTCRLTVRGTETERIRERDRQTDKDMDRENKRETEKERKKDRQIKDILN